MKAHQEEECRIAGVDWSGSEPYYMYIVDSLSLVPVGVLI